MVPKTRANTRLLGSNAPQREGGNCLHSMFVIQIHGPLKSLYYKETDVEGV